MFNCFCKGLKRDKTLLQSLYSKLTGLVNGKMVGTNVDPGITTDALPRSTRSSHQGTFSGRPLAHLATNFCRDFLPGCRTTKGHGKF